MNAGTLTEYDYRARDAQGHDVRGSLRAASPREAAKRITEGGLFVLKLRPAARKWNLFRRTDRRFPVFFCRRLAVMLSAGITVGEALRVISGQSAGKKQGEILISLYRSVADGESLAKAMAEMPEVFDPGITALVDAGEKSGSLDLLLTRLADSLEADYAAREKMKTLMMYPCLLAFALSVVMGILLGYVFPVFADMFRSLELELPLPTRILLGISDFFGNYWLLAAAAVLLLMIFAGWLYQKESFRLRLDRWLLHIPVLGGLAACAERMRLTETLSVLLGSGVVIDQALVLLEGVSGNSFYRKEIRRAHSCVQKGSSLSDALRGNELLSPMLLELLETGERTGEMEIMLKKISEFCRLDLNTREERVRTLMPPTALLVIGGLVGFIIFSAVLPLLDSMTAFM